MDNFDWIFMWEGGGGYLMGLIEVAVDVDGIGMWLALICIEMRKKSGNSRGGRFQNSRRVSGKFPIEIPGMTEIMEWQNAISEEGTQAETGTRPTGTLTHPIPIQIVSFSDTDGIIDWCNSSPSSAILLLLPLLLLSEKIRLNGRCQSIQMCPVVIFCFNSSYEANWMWPFTNLNSLNDFLTPDLHFYSDTVVLNEMNWMGLGWNTPCGNSMRCRHLWAAAVEFQCCGIQWRWLWVAPASRRFIEPAPDCHHYWLNQSGEREMGRWAGVARYPQCPLASPLIIPWNTG